MNYETKNILNRNGEISDYEYTLKNRSTFRISKAIIDTHSSVNIRISDSIYSMVYTPEGYKIDFTGPASEFLGTIHIVGSENRESPEPKPTRINTKRRERAMPKFSYDTLNTYIRNTLGDDPDFKVRRLAEVQAEMENAMKNQDTYLHFLVRNGFPPSKIPPYNKVQSIEIEGTKIVVNQFTDDSES